MATLYQHPRAPVVFTRARPAGCIGRCPTCSQTCTYPVTEQSLAAAKSARRAEWGKFIASRLLDGDEATCWAVAYRMEPADQAEFVPLLERFSALWAKGAQ